MAVLAGGEWLERAADAHKCPKPTRANVGTGDVERGDRWQCHGCHKVYTVTGLDYSEHSIYPPMILWDAGFVPDFRTPEERMPHFSSTGELVGG